MVNSKFNFSKKYSDAAAVVYDQVLKCTGEKTIAAAAVGVYYTRLASRFLDGKDGKLDSGLDGVPLTIIDMALAMSGIEKTMAAMEAGRRGASIKKAKRGAIITPMISAGLEGALDDF